jgi:hypothetical protein
MRSFKESIAQIGVIMQRLAFILVLALALTGVGSVYAMQTNSYSFAATNGNPAVVNFVTNRPGDVMVNAQWTPKNGVRYVLTVKHLTDPADTFSYDHICSVYEPLDGSGSGQAVGDYTCSFVNGPTGYWTVEFRPLSGKVSSVVLSITAETD